VGIGHRLRRFIRRMTCTSHRSAERIWKPAAQPVHGPRKPPGLTVEAEFRRMNLLFLPGKRPRQADARVAQRPTATVRMFRPTRTLRSTSAPTKKPALPMSTVAPVLLLRCGQGTWLWSMSSRLTTETRRWASSIRVCTRSG
jgi:hypothetical protein